jgi:hypothetical protein
MSEPSYDDPQRDCDFCNAKGTVTKGEILAGIPFTYKTPAGVWLRSHLNVKVPAWACSKCKGGYRDGESEPVVDAAVKAARAELEAHHTDPRDCDTCKATASMVYAQRAIDISLAYNALAVDHGPDPEVVKLPKGEKRMAWVPVVLPSWTCPQCGFSYRDQEADLKAQQEANAAREKWGVYWED